MFYLWAVDTKQKFGRRILGLRLAVVALLLKR
jgi:hypothetical protein